MAKIESKIVKIKSSDRKIYTFMADFNNFENLIPADKVTDWKSDGESCSFKVDGIGNAGLKFIEKEEFKVLKITSDGTTPINFFMWVQLKTTDENETAVKITIDPQVNVVMMGMVKKPLQEFVDMLVDRMTEMEF